MRRFLKITVFLLIFLLILAVAVPFLVPVDSLKGPVLARIEAATGRKVTFDTISLSLFPNLALTAQGMKISNPAWAGTGNMAEIKSLRLGVELMPLLHKAVQLKELTLNDPVITLIKQGNQANWQFSGAKPAQAAPQAQSPSSASEGAIAIGSISIKNGTIVYKDAVTGATQTASEVNVTFKAPVLLEKASLDGSLLYGGKKANVTLSVGNPLSLAAGVPSDVDLKFEYGPLAFTWVGSVLQKNGVYDLTGNVAVPSLDTAQLQQAESPRQPAGTAIPASRAPASRWSDAPISMGALNAANADLTITIGKLILPKTTLENIVTAIHLSGGALSGSTSEVKAYDGSFKLAFNANSANAIGVALTADNIKLEPLLHDFAGVENLSGTLKAQMTLATSGSSEHAMITALSGNGNFNVKDGVLKGKNLAAMAKNIGSAFDNNNDRNTAFSECSGTFTMKNGVAANNDLKLESTAIRITGAGTTDLPEWQIHYLLKPLIVVASTPGITVPIRIDGSLDNPRYKPDLQAAITENLKDPAQLKENLKALRKNINSDTLKGLLR